MATRYNINIQTTSAFVAYNEKEVEKIFLDFIKNYKHPQRKLGFENTEIEVKINGKIF